MKVLLLTDTHIGYQLPTCRTLLGKHLESVGEDSFDIIIHTGDWISHKQEHWVPMFKTLRDFTDKPIYGVKGNHDLWQNRDWGRPLTIKELHERQEKIWGEYNIHWLGKEPVTIGDVFITGWDGWYKTKPWTNDFDNMPEYENGIHVQDILSKKAHKDFEKCIYQIRDAKKEGKKTLLVTHHSLTNYRGGQSDMQGNEKYLDIIKDEDVDVFCYGHSHRREESTEIRENGQNLRIFNAGSDYLYPNSIIFKI